MKSVLVAMLASALSLHAQSGALQLDTTLNNLQHAPGYRTAPLGTLGAVVERGNGPVDVLLIPGWGFGADDFEAFMQANRSRYHFVAVTLPGFSGTAAPPMPPAGTSYGEGTWTRAAEDALVRLIAERGLRKPVVIGHFVVGAQLAIRLAADHPALVGGVVILGAEPMRYFASRRDSSGRTPAGREERAASVDRFQAPRWYKYVTTQTWETNNYAPSQYSSDSARAAALWARSARVPMPVMIRYLCEFIAMDFTDAFAAMTVPTEVLVPSFTPGILADPKQSYVKPLFHDAWETVRGTSPRVTISRVGDSRIFVTDDQPAAVEAAMARVAKGARENSQERQPPYDAALAKRLGADARGMKRYVLVMLKTGPRTDFAKDELHTLLTGHQANIKRLAHEGKLVVAGPFGDNTHGYEGIFILNVATQSEAEALLKTDPAIAAGRFAFEAVEWYGSAALQETVAIHQRIDKTGR